MELIGTAKPLCCDIDWKLTKLQNIRSNFPQKQFKFWLIFFNCLKYFLNTVYESSDTWEHIQWIINFHWTLQNMFTFDKPNNACKFTEVNLRMQTTAKRYLIWNRLKWNANMFTIAFYINQHALPIA